MQRNPESVCVSINEQPESQIIVLNTALVGDQMDARNPVFGVEFPSSIPAGLI